MGFKSPLRTTFSLANTRSTFRFLLPALFGRSIITGPSNPFSLPTSPSYSSPSPPPSQPPPRGPPPGDLNSHRINSGRPDSDRYQLIRAMRSSGFERQRSSVPEITEAELERLNLAAAIAKQNMRKWKPGDVYAPHDLSSVEMEKWRKKRPINADAFKALDLDPRKEYKNHSIMWEYVSRMGRIKHPRETGLGNVSQRRLAKAIRRSIGMGLMPSVHNHPEVLETEAIRQHARASLRR